ncbi:hypothetical protein [uncultured Croceicoccus sp.]|uniref:hypothetical protein n=1 Tax=uncultured Croceicoccus sp. TaxID=1295329 RepID=UPI0026078A4F|nr:hypothetical protein [uncultured Croceicoccus sp.]
MIRTVINTTMTSRTLRTAATAILLTGTMPGMAPSAMAQTPDFGDDSSEWARDGECDDMRFEGEAMTTTVLRVEDVQHDAGDCRTAYQDGLITLRQ